MQSAVPKKDHLPEARDFRRRLEKILPNEAERLELLECLGMGLKKSLRVLRWNPLKNASSEEIEKLRRDLGDEPPAEKPDWLREAWILSPDQVQRLDSHPLMGAGLLFVQEAGASEVVGALRIKRGMRVLDMCAAPGAKSTQIAEALGAEGWLVANEPDTRRAKKLDALLARSGAVNVSVYAAGGERLPQLIDFKFDAILVDAPCSGESLYFKRKEQRSDVRDAEVRRCAQIQDKLLEAAAAMTTDGGRILYSTCTYSRDENEDRIEKFLSEHPDWDVLTQQRRWPHRDGVAGGYWALLARKGREHDLPGTRGEAAHEAQPEVSASLEYPQLEDFDAKHLVRHGLKTWEDDVDVYARAMASGAKKGDRPVFVLQKESDLKAFLRGESVASPELQGPSEECDVYWGERCVGIAKRVPGRLNNLLPKTLKAGA